MRLLRVGSRAPKWLAAGVVAAGLTAGGVWYVDSHGGAGSVVDGVTGRASAQEVTPATPTPAESSASAASRPAASKRTGANSKRPTGQVTQITREPASFTMRAADGTQTTYRVLDSTVFMAGRDRPYRFDLLKQGDTAIVRGGGNGQRQGQARGAANGQLIARQVMVRPVGEAGPGKQRQGVSAQDGGSDGAGQ